MEKRKCSLIGYAAKYVLIISFAVTLIGVTCFYGAAYPRKYRNAVETECERFSLEPELIYAVIKTESGFRVDAESDKGAIGLMQILPSTAEYTSRTYFDGETFNLLEPNDNIRCGCAYMAYLKGKFYSETTAIAAYNAGEGNVGEWLADERFSVDGENLDYIPFKETREYVKRVLNRKRVYAFLYNI